MKIKKDINYDKLLSLVLAALLAFSFIIWATEGRYKYEGIVYYVSDNQVPKADNVSFVKQSDGTYSAMLFGIFPVGTVDIIRTERPVVNLGVGCTLILANSDYPSIVQWSDGDSMAKSAGLEIGDYIISIDNSPVSSLDDIVTILDTCSDNTSIQIMRGDQIYDYDITFSSDKHKLGVYINETSFALGTISFTTSDMKFCAIGHSLSGVSVTDCQVAQTWADIEASEMIPTAVIAPSQGIVTATNDYGVIGDSRADWKVGAEIELGWSWEIELSNAQVQLVSNDSTMLKDIKIMGTTEKVMLNSSESSENTYYQVKLLDGSSFLHGMSGSPIIQNGRLIGVLAAVDQKDETIGYFVPAEVMYNALIGL